MSQQATTATLTEKEVAERLEVEHYYTQARLERLYLLPRVLRLLPAREGEAVNVEALEMQAEADRLLQSYQGVSDEGLQKRRKDGASPQKRLLQVYSEVAQGHARVIQVVKPDGVSLGIVLSQGAMRVTSVTPDGPSDTAGCRAVLGWTLLAVNGEPVSSTSEVRGFLTQPGDVTLSLSFFPPLFTPLSGGFGIKRVPGESLGLVVDVDCTITAVADKSPASLLGRHYVGCRLAEVDGKRVGTRETAISALKQAKGDTIEVLAVPKQPSPHCAYPAALLIPEEAKPASLGDTSNLGVTLASLDKQFSWQGGGGVATCTIDGVAPGGLAETLGLQHFLGWPAVVEDCVQQDAEEKPQQAFRFVMVSPEVDFLLLSLPRGERLGFFMDETSCGINDVAEGGHAQKAGMGALVGRRILSCNARTVASSADIKEECGRGASDEPVRLLFGIARNGIYAFSQEAFQGAHTFIQQGRWALSGLPYSIRSMRVPRQLLVEVIDTAVQVSRSFDADASFIMASDACEVFVTTRNDARAKLAAAMSQFEPNLSKEDIAAVLEEHRGKEAHLLDKLTAKYARKDPPPPGASGGGAATAESEADDTRGEAEAEERVRLAAEAKRVLEEAEARAAAAEEDLRRKVQREAEEKARLAAQQKKQREEEEEEKRRASEAAAAAEAEAAAAAAREKEKREKEEAAAAAAAARQKEEEAEEAARRKAEADAAAAERKRKQDEAAAEAAEEEAKRQAEKEAEKERGRAKKREADREREKERRERETRRERDEVGIKEAKGRSRCEALEEAERKERVDKEARMRRSVERTLADKQAKERRAKERAEKEEAEKREHEKLQAERALLEQEQARVQALEDARQAELQREAEERAEAEAAAAAVASAAQQQRAAKGGGGDAEPTRRPPLVPEPVVTPPPEPSPPPSQERSQSPGRDTLPHSSASALLPPAAPNMPVPEEGRDGGGGGGGPPSPAPSVTVTVKRAKLTGGGGGKPGSYLPDPYVLVEVAGAKPMKTRLKKGTAAPAWNECFEAKAEWPLRLKMRVCDGNLLAEKEVLGSASHAIELPLEVGVCANFELPLRQASEGNKETGVLQVSVAGSEALPPLRQRSASVRHAPGPAKQGHYPLGTSPAEGWPHPPPPLLWDRVEVYYLTHCPEKLPEVGGLVRESLRSTGDDPLVKLAEAYGREPRFPRWYVPRGQRCGCACVVAAVVAVACGAEGVAQRRAVFQQTVGRLVEREVEVRRGVQEDCMRAVFALQVQCIDAREEVLKKRQRERADALKLLHQHHVTMQQQQQQQQQQQAQASKSPPAVPARDASQPPPTKGQAFVGGISLAATSSSTASSSSSSTIRLAEKQDAERAAERQPTSATILPSPSFASCEPASVDSSHKQLALPAMSPGKATDFDRAARAASPSKAAPSQKKSPRPRAEALILAVQARLVGPVSFLRRRGASPERGLPVYVVGRRESLNVLTHDHKHTLFEGIYVVLEKGGKVLLGSGTSTQVTLVMSKQSRKELQMAAVGRGGEYTVIPDLKNSKPRPEPMPMEVSGCEVYDLVIESVHGGEPETAKRSVAKSLNCDAADVVVLKQVKVGPDTWAARVAVQRPQARAPDSPPSASSSFSYTTTATMTSAPPMTARRALPTHMTPRELEKDSPRSTSNGHAATESPRVHRTASVVDRLMREAERSFERQMSSVRRDRAMRLVGREGREDDDMVSISRSSSQRPDAIPVDRRASGQGSRLAHRTDGEPRHKPGRRCVQLQQGESKDDIPLDATTSHDSPPRDPQSEGAPASPADLRATPLPPRGPSQSPELAAPPPTPSQPRRDPEPVSALNTPQVAPEPRPRPPKPMSRRQSPEPAAAQSPPGAAPEEAVPRLGGPEGVRRSRHLYTVIKRVADTTTSVALHHALTLLAVPLSLAGGASVLDAVLVLSGEAASPLKVQAAFLSLMDRRPGATGMAMVHGGSRGVCEVPVNELITALRRIAAEYHKVED